MSVVEHARARAPEVKFLRLDRDLVGVSDIAERTGRSRQNVDQWTRGQRRAPGGPFPEPEGTVGSSHVWWAEINTWLRALELDDGEARPTRTQMPLIDLLLSPRKWTARRRGSEFRAEAMRARVARMVADIAPWYTARDAETETL